MSPGGEAVCEMNQLSLGATEVQAADKQNDPHRGDVVTDQCGPVPDGGGRRASMDIVRSGA